MLRLFVLLICCILFINAAAQKAEDIIQQESLKQTVAYLSADSLEGRMTGTIAANKAADYILNSFKKSGLISTRTAPDYVDSFKVDVDNKKKWGRNIVAAILPAIPNDTIIIFSAHYDHLGVQRSITKKGDHIFNGANDNASGIAALLELAKYYHELKSNRYTLLFIAFAGEELGLVGSKHFAEITDSFSIKAVINIDMIGRAEKLQHKRCSVISEDDRIIKKMNKRLNAEIPGDDEIFFTPDPYRDQNLFSRSDQYSFVKNTKTCLLLMATSPDDPYYHSIKDEFKTIDFNYLFKATRNIAVACRLFTE